MCKAPFYANAAIVSIRLTEAGQTIMAMNNGSGQPFESELIRKTDEALGWIRLIGPDHRKIRRTVAARTAGTSFGKIALALNSDVATVRRWYAEGIDMIVAALRREHEVASPSLPLAAE